MHDVNHGVLQKRHIGRAELFPSQRYNLGGMGKDEAV